jgi:predicted nucleotidyltransferase
MCKRAHVLFVLTCKCAPRPAASFAKAQPTAPDAGELAGSTDWLWMSLSRAGRISDAKAMRSPAGHVSHSSPGGLCYDAVVPSLTQKELRAALRSESGALSGLRMLVLHGSRARGDSHAHSDWDLAYEADAVFDPDGLLAVLAERLDADGIDLVDLDRAGALLRYRVARDGVVLFERDPDRFRRFWLDAVDTWCDLAPVLDPAYARVLGALPR